MRIARLDQHEAAGIYAQKRQPRPIKCARLARGLGLDDPDDGRAGLCRSPGKTRSQGKGKTGGRRAGGRTSRDDLMQGAAFKPALQGAIEAARLLRIAQSHPAAPGGCRRSSFRQARSRRQPPPERGDFRAQKIHPVPKGRQASVWSPLRDSSPFVLIDSSLQDLSQAEC